MGMRALACALVLATFGCSTTHWQVRPESAAAREWMERHTGDSVEVETPAGERTHVVIEAVSPTELRFTTREPPAVPLEQVSRVVEVRHARGALEGAGLGLAAGLLFGAAWGATTTLSPYDRSSDCTIVCNQADQVKLDALMFGALGLILGTITGAAVGDRDVLDLR
jgi:uncharacterized membrane protein